MAGKVQYICEVKHGPSEGTGGTTGDGCSDGGRLPTDTLRDGGGNQACIVDVVIDCGELNRRGDQVTCRARTSWDRSSAMKLFTWNAGNNQKREYAAIGQGWSGRA